MSLHTMQGATARALGGPARWSWALAALILALGPARDAGAVIPNWWSQAHFSATRLGDLLNAGGAVGTPDNVEPTMTAGEWTWGLDTGTPLGTHAPARHGGAPAGGTAGTWANPKHFAVEAPGAARVRNSITALTGAQAWVLDRAFGLQQALPLWDPRGVVAQAALHGFYCGGGLGHDIHSTWEFLPWHRAFAYYEEKILRRLLADDLAANPGAYNPAQTNAAQNFALPYWDWSANPNAGNNLTVPAAYQAGHLGPAGIWRASQFTTVTNLYGQPIALRTEMNRMLSFKSPKAVAGGPALKGMASSLIHDSTHAVPTGVGGNMGSVPGAPRDPIFYPHHLMLDRLWEQWLALGNTSHVANVATVVQPGVVGNVQVDPNQRQAESRSKHWTPGARTRRNPSQNAFRNIVYKFVDGDGHWVDIRVRDVLDPANQLRYTYNNLNINFP